MKKNYILCLLLLVSINISAQQGDDWSDGEIGNWTNPDGSVTNIEVLQNPDDASDFYIQKNGDGTNTAIGELAIQNTVDYMNDLSCNNGSGIDCFGWIELIVKNENDFDLDIRLGFTGANNTKIVSDIGDINPNLDLDWYTVDIIGGYTVVEGNDTIDDVFSDIQEIKIILNEELSYTGTYDAGNLIVSNLFYVWLLSTEEQILQNVSLFPNPVIDRLHITLDNSIEKFTVSLYDVLGKEVNNYSLLNNQSSIDVSGLNKGVYFAKISSGDASITRKIIKR